MVEGRPSGTELHGMFQCDDRRLAVAGPIVSHPQGIPVGGPVRLGFDGFRGQRDGPRRIALGRVGCVGKEPGQVIAEIALDLRRRRGVRPRRRPFEQVERVLPGLGGLPVLPEVSQEPAEPLAGESQVAARSSIVGMQGGTDPPEVQGPSPGPLRLGQIAGGGQPLGQLSLSNRQRLVTLPGPEVESVGPPSISKDQPIDWLPA